MRLNGEIEEDEEEEKVAKSLNSQTYSTGIGFPQLQSQNLVVGYALTSKKKKSFLQPKLIRLAWYYSTRTNSFPHKLFHYFRLFQLNFQDLYN